MANDPATMGGVENDESAVVVVVDSVVVSELLLLDSLPSEPLLLDSLPIELLLLLMLDSPPNELLPVRPFDREQSFPSELLRSWVVHCWETSMRGMPLSSRTGIIVI